MLIPKKTKYRFNHSLKYEGKVKGNKEVNYGDFGLQALEGNYISNKVIESGRKVISPYIKLKGKENGKMWIRIFPHLGKSKKPLEVRMGSGKGSIENWVAVVKSGTIIFEIKGLSRENSYFILKKASYKLPGKYKIIERRI